MKVTHVSDPSRLHRSPRSQAVADLGEAEVSTRLLHDADGRQGVPDWARTSFGSRGTEVAKWLDEGVFYLVSPLDSANMTEVEITEEQEAMLFWLNRNQVEHVRAVD